MENQAIDSEILELEKQKIDLQKTYDAVTKQNKYQVADDNSILNLFGFGHSYQDEVESAKKALTDVDNRLNELYKTTEEGSKGASIGLTNVGESYTDTAQEITENTEKVSDEFQTFYDNLNQQKTAHLITDEQYNAQLLENLTTNNRDKMGVYNKYWGEVLDAQDSANKSAMSAQTKADTALNKKAAQTAKEWIQTWSGAGNKIISKYESDLNDLLSKQEDFQNKLKDIAGGLLTESEADEDGNTTKGLTDYAEKNRELIKYYNALQELNSMEVVPDSMIDEIKSMDVQDAITAINELKSKDVDGSLDEYIASYERFQQNAANASTNMYASAINTVKTQFVDEYKALINTLPEDLKQSGIDTMNGLMDGIMSQKNGMLAEIRQLAQDLVDAYNEKMNIHSPSRVMFKSGANTGEGAILGIKSKEAELRKAIADMLQTPDGSELANRLRTSVQLEMADMSASVMAKTTVINNRASDKAGDVKIDYHPEFHSPKTLSRAEIRREENQLVQRIAGMVKP